MAITMTSFDQVSALIGHMAQAERAHENKDASFEVLKAFSAKKAAKEEVKALKNEIERLRAEEKECSDTIFSDGGRGELQEAQIKRGIETEQMQKVATAQQEQIESLQRDMKDVHESFESSKAVSEDVRKDVEAAIQAAISI